MGMKSEKIDTPQKLTLPSAMNVSSTLALNVPGHSDLQQTVGEGFLHIWDGVLLHHPSAGAILYSRSDVPFNS